jgi:hypothetical protein
MSNFPNSLDDDSTILRVDNNLSSIGADVINALRSAMFAVEANIGINAQGSTGSISDFLQVAHNLDGTIKPSALLSLGLVTLPIDNSQISPTAAIQESKLALTYSTTSLFNLFTSLNTSVDVLNGFLTTVGIQIAPHIEGIAYNHLLSAIHIDSGSNLVKTNPVPGITSPGTSVINRDTVNLETLLQDINTDLVAHEKADSSAGVTALTGGTVPPENYAHVAEGIWVDSSNFISIPQANNDLQKIADFIDNSSLLLLGSRTQNLFANGVARTARSTSLTSDGYGANLIPPTPCIAYLLNQPPGPISSSPIDDVNHGDDIVLFAPTTDQLSTFNFDAQFAQVQNGDILTINYGTGLAFQFVIDSTKAVIAGGNRTYAVRLNARNPFTSDGYDGYSSARIDKALFNRNKYHALASSRVPNSINAYESLIVANPRGAVALGVGFDPSQFNSTHYNLYLSILQNGDLSTILNLPAIDVTGNKGTTPGQYTLQNIIDAANTALRAPGFNFRMIAFDYQGQFGITLADSYNNSGFSIISGTVNSSGLYDASSASVFTNNVVDNFNLIDPLGFGSLGSNLASPPPAVSYANVDVARLAPTIVFSPLKRNFYYVNGVERDTVNSDPTNIHGLVDTFGDGYWPAIILPFPATQVLANRVEVTYQVNQDLSTSGLRAGKTLVVQPAFLTSDSRFNFRDYGRFIIKTVSYQNCNSPTAFTNITVYDGVHGAGVSPAATSTNIPVSLYFSDDSVAFDAENVFDDASAGNYKRFFENYVTQAGHTFTHERARFLTTPPVDGNLITNINLYSVSPKLRGYATNNDKEIRLVISSYDQTTGIYDGYLARATFPGPALSNFGPTTTGKKGEIVRFYDETNIDYIDFKFDLGTATSSFSTQAIDIQLFGTLELDEELFFLSSCQINDATKEISYLQDERQFGNTSEEQFTNSAIDFITAIPRATEANGVINGFGALSVGASSISFNGGSALIDGKIVLLNTSTVFLPIVQETSAAIPPVNTISWFVCVNERSEIELVASTDFSPSLASTTYAGLDHNRIFTVQNPNLSTPVSYAVRGTYLSNLVANLDDLVPLYLATATVTGPTTWTITTLTATDIRRFV